MRVLLQSASTYNYTPVGRPGIGCHSTGSVELHSIFDTIPSAKQLKEKATVIQDQVDEAKTMPKRSNVRETVLVP